MVRGVRSTAIIINPAHPKTRQANTLMHEWSHLELKHKPNRVDQFDHDIVMLSDYPAELEEEADWLAGAMLAPRDGLAYFARKGAENAEIAEHFGISEQLAGWRRRMTGIDRQFRP
jgi:Zn-dependent peptidase ImmA (M78 family)